MNTAKTLTPVLLAVFMLSVGCTKKPEAEGYRVLSYDAATPRISDPFAAAAWILLFIRTLGFMSFPAGLAVSA